VSRDGENHHHISFNQHGSFSFGIQNINTRSKGNDVEAVRSVLEAVLANRQELDLDVEPARELDRNVEVLRRAVEDNDLDRPEVRSAGKVLAATANTLFLGAGGQCPVGGVQGRRRPVAGREGSGCRPVGCLELGAETPNLISACACGPGGSR